MADPDELEPQGEYDENPGSPFEYWN